MAGYEQYREAVKAINRSAVATPRTITKEDFLKIEIKSWLTGEMLFAHEADENSVKITLEAGKKIGANLSRANLNGANLNGANLYGATLNGANLSRANLSRANLNGANLSRANLSRANLNGANLARANLDGEKIQDIKQVGHIGSRGGFTILFKTEKSIQVRCGCFSGTLEEFAEQVEGTHGENKHGIEYRALIEFIKKIWGAV